MSSHSFGRYRFALVAGCLFLASGAIAPRVEAFQVPTYPTSISGGYAHTCALFSNGAVKCWGANTEGQLGFSYVNMLKSSLPVPVQLKGSAKAISSGDEFNCALLTSGEVQCWGANDKGQAGSSNSGAFPIAAPVPLAGPAIAIASGQEHSCAVVKMPVSTIVQCWGSNSSWQLGNSIVSAYSQIPQTVVNVAGATSLAAGSGHTCANSNAGTICWGANEEGQLGRGIFSNTEMPGFVSSQVKFSSIAAGRSSNSTCGISAGTLTCWGENYNGALGVGSNADTAIPTSVPGLSSVTSFFASTEILGTVGCAIDSKKLYCAGSPMEGPFGIFNSNLPIPMLTVPSQVTAGTMTSRFACFLVPGPIAFSAGVKCMGSGFFGELGNGEYSYSEFPVDVKF